MSECTLVIKNNSGRVLDRILAWHTSGEPEPMDLLGPTALINTSAVAAGATLSASVSLSWGSPTDYWTIPVVFHGDGTTYFISGLTGSAYKEYEVSDGSTITFTLNPYTTGTTNQADVTVSYSGDDGGTAFFLNSTVVTVISIVHAVAEVVSEGAE